MKPIFHSFLTAGVCLAASIVTAGVPFFSAPITKARKEKSSIQVYWMDSSMTNRSDESDGWSLQLPLDHPLFVEGVVTAFKEDPTPRYWSTAALRAISRCCWNKQEFVNALRTAYAVCRREPDSLADAAWLARCMSVSKETHDDAMDILKAIDEKHPCIESRWNLFWTCWKNGEMNEAVPYAERLLSDFDGLTQNQAEALMCFMESNSCATIPEEALVATDYANKRQVETSVAEINGIEVPFDCPSGFSGDFVFDNAIVLDCYPPAKLKAIAEDCFSGNTRFPFSSTPICERVVAAYEANHTGWTPNQLLLVAKSYMVLQRFSHAETLLESAVVANPDNPELFVSLVEVKLLDSRSFEEGLKLALDGWDRFSSERCRELALWGLVKTQQWDKCVPVVESYLAGLNEHPNLDYVLAAMFIFCLKTSDVEFGRKVFMALDETYWIGFNKNEYARLRESSLGGAVINRYNPEWLPNNTRKAFSQGEAEILIRFVPRTESQKASGVY